MKETIYCKKALIKLTTIFSATAIECIEIFFGKKCFLNAPWNVVNHLKSEFDLILTIGSSNSSYSALMYTGINHQALKVFAGIDAIDAETASDILGELVNTYSGMIADKKEFSDRFGILTQAVPVLNTYGRSYLPFIWGIEGYVYVEEHSIYLGYTIRSNNTFQEYGSAAPTGDCLQVLT